jgi:hypothetical protein
MRSVGVKRVFIYVFVLKPLYTTIEVTLQYQSISE